MLYAHRKRPVQHDPAKAHRPVPPSIEIFKPATWEAIFTEVRELFNASSKGGSRKLVQRCHDSDSHASSDAVNVEGTTLLGHGLEI